VSGSGISWAICKSAPRSRQITTPAPHHLVFLQAGCPSCRPTNSVKALKAYCDKENENVNLASHKRQKYQNKAKNLRITYVLGLHGEWKLIKTKHF